MSAPDRLCILAISGAISVDALSGHGVWVQRYCQRGGAVREAGSGRRSGTAEPCWPRRRGHRATPSRTSASASGPSGGCTVRPPRGRPEVLALDVEDVGLVAPAGQSKAQGRCRRRHHLAHRHSPAPASPAEGPQVRAGSHHRAESAGPAARDQPWPPRPGPAQLPAGRRPVLRGLRRRDPCTSSGAPCSLTTPGKAPGRCC